MTAPAKTAKSAQCMKCVYHFITYDTRFPYGCRALNFKSRVPPQQEVKAASGMDCQMFQRRPASADFSVK